MVGKERISVLQFGASGQLARELLRAASSRANIEIHALARDRADLRYPEQVAAAVRDAGPVEFVVNAAAYTAVDKAEAEPDSAMRINARSVGALAKACGERNIPLIHVSTDYVYDGTKAGPYVETDKTNPLGVYGRTKLEGEAAIRAAIESHVIIRTSWVYASHGTNFVKTMLRLGAERDELRIVDDQYGAPTAACDLAETILSMVERLAVKQSPDLFGTFHYTAKGETSWRGFAEAIFEEARPWAGIKARIVPISSADFPAAARRPTNSRLDCTKIERSYGIVRKPWRASLVRVLEDLKTGQGVS